MLADLEDFVTWMFVLVDAVWQEIAPLSHRRGPNPTTCSDSELITVALVSACRGRRITRWADEARLEAMAERVRANPAIITQRKALIEHVFGTIKRSMDQGYFRKIVSG